MSTINDFGIPGVGTGIMQPKMKNRWRVTFTNFGGGADSTPVSMNAVRVTRPNLNLAEVEQHRYNSIAYVQGKHNWEPMSLTIEDDVASSASRVIQEQIQKQQYLTGVEGPWLATAPEGSVYKFTTRLDLLDGGTNVLERWHVQGGWLTNVDYTDLDYEANDKVQIALTVRFDHAYQEFVTYDGGPGMATG